MIQYYVKSGGGAYPAVDGTLNNEWGSVKDAVDKHAVDPFQGDDKLQIETGLSWRDKIIFTGLPAGMEIHSSTPGTYARITNTIPVQTGDWATTGLNNGHLTNPGVEYTLAFDATADRLVFIENNVRIPGRMDFSQGSDPLNFFPQAGTLAPGEFAWVGGTTNILYYRPTDDLLDKDCELGDGYDSGLRFEKCHNLLTLTDIEGYGGCSSGAAGIYFSDCQDIDLNNVLGAHSWRHGVICDRKCDNIRYNEVYADDVFWHGVGQVGPIPGTRNITVTRSGTTATVTTDTNHDFVDGETARLYEMLAAEYNGDYPVLTSGSNWFTITVPDTHAATTSGKTLDPTMRAMTYGKIRSSRINWLWTDFGDGNAIITQPWKTVTGGDLRSKTVGNAVHTDAHRTYLKDNGFDQCGLFVNNGAAFDTANCTIDKVYGEDVVGSLLSLSGGSDSEGQYTPQQVVRLFIAVNCGLGSRDMLTSHNPLAILSNNGATNNVSVEAGVITGGKSGSPNNGKRGAVDMYANKGADLVVALGRIIVTGVDGNHAISILEQVNSTVTYTGHDNQFNSGAAANRFVIQRNGGAVVEHDLVNWKVNTGEADSSSEGNPKLSVGASAGKEIAPIYPSTFSPMYHGGDPINAEDDYHGYPFNIGGPTPGPIEVPGGSIKGATSGLYLPSFSSPAVFTQVPGVSLSDTFARGAGGTLADSAESDTTQEWTHDANAYTMDGNRLIPNQDYKRTDLDSFITKKIIKMEFSITPATDQSQRIYILNRVMQYNDEWRAAVIVRVATPGVALLTLDRVVLGVTTRSREVPITVDVEVPQKLVLEDDGFTQTLYIEGYYDPSDPTTFISSHDINFNFDPLNDHPGDVPARPLRGDPNHNATETWVGMRTGGASNGEEYIYSFTVDNLSVPTQVIEYEGHFMEGLDEDATSNGGNPLLWTPNFYSSDNLRVIIFRNMWGDLEGAPINGIPQYDFSPLDVEMQELEDYYAATGDFRRMVVLLTDKSWKNQEFPMPVDMRPADPTNAADRDASYAAAIRPYGTTIGSLGWCVKRWKNWNDEAAPAKRYAACIKAVSDHFKGNIHFQGVQTGESSLSFDRDDPDQLDLANHNNADYMEYFKLILGEVHTKFKENGHTFYWAQNFFGISNENLNGVTQTNAAVSEDYNLMYMIAGNPAYVTRANALGKTPYPNSPGGAQVNMTDHIVVGAPDILKHYYKAVGLYNTVYNTFYLHHGSLRMYITCQKDSYKDTNVAASSVPTPNPEILSTMQELFDIAQHGILNGSELPPDPAIVDLDANQPERPFTVESMMWKRDFWGGGLRPFTDAQAVMAANPIVKVGP